MKIVLHIGQSKTGTSAIQAYLTLNREVLLQAGVLYPVASVAGMQIDFGNHNPLADALMGLSRYPYFTTEQYFETFFATAQKHASSTMILSAEHFFGGEPRVWDVENDAAYYNQYRQKIARLAPFLQGHDVDILVYLRPQVDWLASAVSQTVRIERLIRQQPIYQNDQQFFELVKPILRYYSLLEIWREELKPSNIKAVSYDRKSLHQNNSIADFMLRAGLQGVKLKFGSESLEVNQSISPELIEVKKILNRELHTKNEERVIIACLRALTSRAGETKPYWLSADLIQQVKDFVAEENENLNKRYIDGSPLQAESSAAAKRIKHDMSPDEIQKAMRLFKQEYRKPKYRLIHLRTAVLIFLRDNALPVHSALHQLKRLYRKIRFRNQASA